MNEVWKSTSLHLTLPSTVPHAAPTCPSWPFSCKSSSYYHPPMASMWDVLMWAKGRHELTISTCHRLWCPLCASLITLTSPVKFFHLLKPHSEFSALPGFLANVLFLALQSEPFLKVSYPLLYVSFHTTFLCNDTHSHNLSPPSQDCIPSPGPSPELKSWLSSCIQNTSVSVFLRLKICNNFVTETPGDPSRSCSPHRKPITERAYCQGRRV